MICNIGMISVTGNTGITGMIYETIHCLENLWYNWCL